MTETELDYFATPGPATDLRDYSELVDPLPSDPKLLAQVVRGLILHYGVAAMQGLLFSAERHADEKRFGAAATLRGILRLDASPLTVERPVERKMLGYCHHFALLHCAFLRAKGVPARARCGFAAYYRQGAWIDHWVTEYWDGHGWMLIDADSGRDSLTRDDFRDGGTAWLRCRAGRSDPFRYGNHVLWGWDELRGSLVNDLGALNKMEMGDWSWCDELQVEPLDQPHTTIDRLMDSVAPAVSEASSVEELRLAYRSDALLQPPVSLLAREPAGASL
jgi:hypothetical protein